MASDPGLRRRHDVEQPGVELEHLDRAPRQADAVDVLAAAAVQIPVTSRSSARQISRAASVASVGVASRLSPGPSQTVKRSPARSASTSETTR